MPQLREAGSCGRCTSPADYASGPEGHPGGARRRGVPMLPTLGTRAAPSPPARSREWRAYRAPRVPPARHRWWRWSLRNLPRNLPREQVQPSRSVEFKALKFTGTFGQLPQAGPVRDTRKEEGFLAGHRLGPRRVDLEAYPATVGREADWSDQQEIGRGVY